MRKRSKTRQQLLLEVEELGARLKEAEATLSAIRRGEVDALVVLSEHGEQVFTLRGADHTYRVLIEAMREGAVTLTGDGTILYCNSRFAQMLKMPMERVIGSSMARLVAPADHSLLEALLRHSSQGSAKAELTLHAQDGRPVPVYFSINPVQMDGVACLCLVATDLTEQKRNEQMVAAGRLARSILEQAAEAIVVCDERGRIIQANAAAHRLCGRSPIWESFAERFPLHLNVAKGSAGLTEAGQATTTPPAFSLEAALRGHVFRGLEASLARADGPVAHVLVSAGPLVGAHHEILGCVVTLIDITERKLAEQVLRDSEKRFRALIENSSDGISLLDADGTILYISPTSTKISGYRIDAVVGRSRFEFIHPDDRDYVKMLFAELVREPGKIICTQHRVRHKDGSWWWAETVSTNLLDDPSIQAIVINYQDITERKRAEEALRLYTQRLGAVREIDRAILAAQSLDEVARAALSRLCPLTPCRQALIVLFDLERSEARIIARFVDGELRASEETAEPIDDYGSVETLRQGSCYEVEDLAALDQVPPVLQRLLDEGVRSFITVPLFNEEGLIGGLSLFATAPAAFDPEHRDMAREVANHLTIAIQQARLREKLQRHAVELEHRVAERTAELQEVNAELEAFAYTVSHDLRAPLRTMQGMAQALMEDYAGRLDPVAHNYAQFIVDAAQQMDTMIQDLLAYSRLSRTDMHLQMVSVSSIVEEALGQLKAELDQRQAQVVIEGPLHCVLGHPATLVQVVVNLLTNAVKFVAAGVAPQVRIRTESQGEWVRLWVEDNGIGIAPEHRKQIFKVFERLHSMETYPGTGIGLAIVRRAVERMGGRVKVESEVGRGSRFAIELKGASEMR
jgi:PAS domain S-box-containing protein